LKKIVKYIKKHKIKSAILATLLVYYCFCLPKQLFTDPTATVIESRDGELIGALIAEDGQWRFPHNDSIPEKFKVCLLQFEDEYFYKHPGFNLYAISELFQCVSRRYQFDIHLITPGAAVSMIEILCY